MKNLIYYISEKIQFPNVKDKVTKELYKGTKKTLVSVLILASVFLYLFWSKTQANLLLLTWISLIIILSMNRFYDYVEYQKCDGKNYDKWYRLFKNKALMNAVLWGMTPMLFFHVSNELEQIMIVLFLVGLSGGATAFIFDFRISSIFISILLLPTLYMLSFSSIPFAPILQILLVIFYLLLLLASKHLNQLFHDSYTAQERYHWTKELLTIKEKKLTSLLEQAPIGIFYYDRELKILSSNSTFNEIFSPSRNLTNFDLKQIPDQYVVSMLHKVLHRNSNKEIVGSYNFSLREKKIWVELICSPLVDEHNNVIGGIGTIEDKTIEHEAYEKINFISLHDALTNLPNRRSYQEYMSTLTRREDHQTDFSILFYMDLNHFKQINDTFGHVVGDKLLLEVAKRLKALEIKNKYLSRIGGDEFIMVEPYCENNFIEAQKTARKIARTIKNLFKGAFEIEGLDLYVTTSIGIVLVEPKSNDIEQILRQADMAMYQTKREGLNNIRFYDHSLDLKQRELTSLQHDLKKAIKNNELELYYQPIVDINNDVIHAIEALVRWNHPIKGLIMPDNFLPMATESGLITKIGWWVAKEVCRQLYLWKNAHVINFEYISININARQLNEINFVEQLDACITKGGINPSLLKLELTETTLLKNFDKTQEIIQRLNEKGIECSIDDFGTGYSSLSYLNKFSFKVLKIDKTFVNDILTNRESQELVKSIISIGKQFNYKIIIEGVETESQRSKLLQLDKNVYYQGYLYSPAIPAEEFENKFLGYVYHI